MTDYQTQIWNGFREKVKGCMKLNNYERALDTLDTAEATFQFNHQPPPQSLPIYKAFVRVLQEHQEAEMDGRMEDAKRIEEAIFAKLG